MSKLCHVLVFQLLIPSRLLRLMPPMSVTVVFLSKDFIPNQPEQIVRFHSGVWNSAQSNYSTIKKEILSIVLCISKFQDDLLNQKFLIRVDCKSAKHVLEKDVKNIASKHIFARWQAILSIFDFEIEYIKGSQNSIPDFLTREFL
jgi:hypothetical protein